MNITIARKIVIIKTGVAVTFCDKTDDEYWN